MRIFVTGTGRCGTVTFSKACAHISNFTSGHETHTNKRRGGRLGGDVANWDYPDNHIEISSQLVIAIPILKKKYPDARWIHLVREDRDACARSLCGWSDMAAFAKYWFLNAQPDPLATAYAIYDTVRGMAEAMLPDAFIFRLEQAASDWPACWEFMHAAGDRRAAAAEFQTRYNATIRREDGILTKGPVARPFIE